MQMDKEARDKFRELAERWRELGIKKKERKEDSYFTVVDFVAELLTLIDQCSDGWIPVEERLPGNGEMVLCIFYDGEKELCEYCAGDEPTWLSCAHGNWIASDSVGAWMSIPEPPKGE